MKKRVIIYSIVIVLLLISLILSTTGCENLKYRTLQAGLVNTVNEGSCVIK